MRAATGFEKDVMRQRNFLVGAACAAIIAGVAAFLIGLSQPTGHSQVADTRSPMSTR